MERPDGFSGTYRLVYITESAMEAPNRSKADAWVHRWRHWRGRGALDRTTVGGAHVDIPFVSFFEEHGYQHRLSDLREAHSWE